VERLELEQLVNLRRTNKIILTQPINRMGGEINLALVIACRKIRVVVFSIDYPGHGIRHVAFSRHD
jgi:hypothetical protein